MRILNWIRKKLGLCIHDMKCVSRYCAVEGTIAVWKITYKCSKCGGMDFKTKTM